jgi:hypothetical protein
VLVPGGEPVVDGNSRKRNGDGLTDNEAIALKHLMKMSVKEPVPIPEGYGQIAGLRGTSLVQWQSRVTRSIWRNITDKSNSEMVKLQRGLQRKDLVDTDGEVVWATPKPAV